LYELIRFTDNFLITPVPIQHASKLLEEVSILFRITLYTQ